MLEVKDEIYIEVDHRLCAESRRVSASVLCFADSFAIGDRKLVSGENGAAEVTCSKIRPANEWERYPSMPYDHIAFFISG